MWMDELMCSLSGGHCKTSVKSVKHDFRQRRKKKLLPSYLPLLADSQCLFDKLLSRFFNFGGIDGQRL